MYLAAHIIRSSYGTAAQDLPDRPAPSISDDITFVLYLVVNQCGLPCGISFNATKRAFYIQKVSYKTDRWQKGRLASTAARLAFENGPRIVLIL